MSIQQFNEAKTIVHTAARIGAAIPEEIAEAMAHLEDITRNPPPAARPGSIATELAQHIGDPVKMDKALKAAATTLAAADAEAKIRAFMAETCGARIRGMMRGQAEQIVTAFGTALAGDLATLEANAGRLPQWFNEQQAASLDPVTFEAWTLARDAYARLTSASTALAPLYSGAVPSKHAIQFPHAAASALRLASPPRFDTPRDAYAFRDALAGRTERVQGVAGQGSTFVDGLFVPTVLAHVGATFEWATPAEVTKRAERVVTGMARESVTV